MRAADLHRQSFDVLVVGGGIIGAGVARDAARRGLRVALFEQADFGGGTTAGSTRLVHGGLRYLEMLDFGLVRLDLREREILLRIAPHLVKPLGFLLPFYRQSAYTRLKMRAGMWLYDLLSFDRSLPGHSMLTRDETLEAEPRLTPEGLQGAASYSDAQAALPERLCLENLIDARLHGAAPCNYARVVGCVVRDGRVAGLRVNDLIAQREVEVNGRVVVNASGPWFDRVAGVLTGPSRRIRTTRGIHLACPSPPSAALALPSAVDGRLVFVLPWLGYAWIGTTDVDFDDDPSDVRATPEEIAYLCASVSPYIGDVGPVAFTNAGVRALVREEGTESSVSRVHKVVAEHDPVGLISVLGGKLTGFRAIAEQVTDRVCRLLDVTSRSTTADTPLPGAGPLPEAWRVGVPPELFTHLASLLGSRAEDVLALSNAQPALAQRLCPEAPDIGAQVTFAVREECCERIVDFLFRRTRLAFTDHRGRGAIARVAGIMREELGWSDARLGEEMAMAHAALDWGQVSNHADPR
jgi:glycerol-3-phosphate dehydrogenase